MTGKSSQLASEHFANQHPSKHILEKFSRGAAFASERHGVELSGSFAALIDSAKVSAAMLALGALSLQKGGQALQIFPLALFALSSILWQSARSSWLGFSRLEHLHRELLEEHREIATNRAQEREELEALYAIKGFEHPLLGQVVDTLMADDDRLLRVMLEEELGMTLGVHEHPLKQGAFAGIGAFAASAVIIAALFFGGLWAGVGAGAFLIALNSGVAARIEGNRVLEALLWNLSLFASIAATTHFAAELSWR